jgi:hypothetical protein
MLIMSIISDVATLQVDYTDAFVHADIDKPPNWDIMMELEKERSGVYIEMPRVLGEYGKVLKLKKSLYGLKHPGISSCTSRENLKKLGLPRVKMTHVWL